MTLSEAARFGAYFRWEQKAGDGWRPWAELARPDIAAERVGAAHTALTRMFRLDPADVPVRVVASITFLGYAARVVSPLLAATVLGGGTPAVAPERLWWRPVDSGPLPVAYGKGDGDHGETATVLEGLLGPLTATFRQRFRLSPRVLHGNVASALGGAAGMIATAAPELAAPAAAVVARLLAVPPLAGAGDLVRPDPEAERWFLVRRNCCLYYRIPGGGTCGDCVLTPQADRIRAWRATLSP
jgi:hypothetical protein